jgi:hypothetical protein
MSDAMSYQAWRMEGSVNAIAQRLECFRERETEEQEGWINAQLKELPFSWARSAKKWHSIKTKELGIPAANLWLLETSDKWKSAAIPLNAGQDELRALAIEQANKMFDLAGLATDVAQLRRFQAGSCDRYGVEPPDGSFSNDAAITAMTDWEWWLPRMKRAAARRFECVARELGFVNVTAGLYCSNETYARHCSQRKRNRKMMESTILANENGDELSLADLSDSSNANPSNRRNGLMVQIRGMADYAKEYGHAPLFAVVTCPSRMHVFKIDQATGKAIPNARFDGTSPRDAQDYLQGLWQRIRAVFDREGICFYGMRTTEANHDGTPHWNLLLFVPPGQMDRAKAIIQSYALADSPNEPGAQKCRVRFEDIDSRRGDAVSYIAKYIAKGTDAAGLDNGLFGDSAATAAQRLRAWASTHGIRQFQFFGSPPVGLWREMRRIPESSLEGAPSGFKDAWQAAQKQGSDRADFCRFWKAIGGKVKRVKDYLLQLDKRAADGLDRYGKALPPETAGLEWKPSGDVFESVRHVWEVVSSWGVRVASPWTRVNNCTSTKSVHIKGRELRGNLAAFTDQQHQKRKGRNPSAPAGLPPNHNRMNGAFEYGY